MKRVNLIYEHSVFRNKFQALQEAEKEREFCNHTLEHLLDVARIAWILVQEQQLPLQKDVVYAAALLHDLGRYRQYEEAIPHHQASAELAAAILPDAGYTAEETAMMVDAIGQHGTEPQSQSILAQVLYQADKLSRNCFQCAAQAQCKWPVEKRNRTIFY